MAITMKKESPAPVATIANHLSYAVEALHAAQTSVDKLRLELAEATCPYKVGQVIKTNKGLGVNGLSIQAISVPRFPNLTDNRWTMDTLAFGKDGTITRRSVGIDEFEANVCLTVEVVS